MNLTTTQAQQLRAYVKGEGEDMPPKWLIDYAYAHWNDVIPYGTLTGDDATVDEWLVDNIEQVIFTFAPYLQD